MMHETDYNVETDYTLSYSQSIEKIAIDVGLIYYSFGGGDTGEIYVSAGYDTLLKSKYYILSGI